MPVVRPDSEIELLAGKELLDDEIELSGGGDSDSDSDSLPSSFSSQEVMPRQGALLHQHVLHA